MTEYQHIIDLIAGNWKARFSDAPVKPDFYLRGIDTLTHLRHFTSLTDTYGRDKALDLTLAFIAKTASWTDYFGCSLRAQLLGLINEHFAEIRREEENRLRDKYADELEPDTATERQQ